MKGKQAKADEFCDISSPGTFSTGSPSFFIMLEKISLPPPASRSKCLNTGLLESLAHFESFNKNCALTQTDVCPNCRGAGQRISQQFA